MTICGTQGSKTKSQILFLFPAQSISPTLTPQQLLHLLHLLISLLRLIPRSLGGHDIKILRNTHLSCRPRLSRTVTNPLREFSLLTLLRRRSTTAMSAIIMVPTTVSAIVSRWATCSGATASYRDCPIARSNLNTVRALCTIRRWVGCGRKRQTWSRAAYLTPRWQL